MNGEVIGAGGGGEGGLSSLLQNKLFLQFLAGFGSDVSAYGTDTSKGFQPTNLNAMVQQNIAAQSYMKLLKQLLGPDGSKATFSKDGINLTLPQESSMLSSILQGTGPGGVWEGMAAPLGTPRGLTGAAPRRDVDAVNPFVSSQSEISAADLAGLTPQNISQALSGALDIETLKRKSVSDVVDALYKQSLTGYYEALTEKERRPGEVGRPFPILVPNVGEVSLEEWKALPKDEQDYAIYLHGSKAIGDKDPMTREEFESLEPTEHERLLRSLLKHPDLLGVEKALREAGATRIDLSTKLTEKKALSEVDRQNEVMRPGFHQEVLEDLQKDTRAWRSTSEAEEFAKATGKTFEQARSIIQKAKHREAMDKQIRQAFPGAKWSRKGWYVGGKLIVRDPYAVE